MSTILRSIAGRLFGLDADGYATSPVGLKIPDLRVGASGSELPVSGSGVVTTASTGSTIGAGGFTALAASTAAAFVLAGPITGTRKTLHATSTSTGQVVTLVSGNFSSTDGATGTIATFTGVGQTLELLAKSTGIYAVLNRQGAVTIA